jgi:hypothetical protein
VACPGWIYHNRHRVENLWARLNTVHFMILIAAVKSIRTVGCGVRGRSL